MRSHILKAEGVRKYFGTRRILDIEELELIEGESYVLTGENGSGKTTLLRVLAGLESAEMDVFRFDGKTVDPKTYPEWMRREVIYVHQHPYLFRGSIIDNIAYGLKIRGMKASVRERILAEAVEWAGVANLLGVPSHKLSGGEKQRVALARARVLRPRLFLLDEPTANLDAEARRQIIKLIGELCAENRTVVLACHDREIIELPHMHRLHMESGRIDAQASPEIRG